MTNEELIVKIKDCQTKRNSYMEQLYTQNRAFIYKTALQYSKTTEIEDLMQEAYIVLEEVVHNFKTEMNTKFITYFGKVLKWRFSAYAFRTSIPIKMPSEYKELIRKYYQFNQEYFQQYGTKPADEDFMRALSISKETLCELHIAIICLHTCSFDVPLNDSEDILLKDTIPADVDIEREIADSTEQEYFKKVLHRAVDKLSLDKKNVIDCYYFQNKTFEQTASDLNFPLSDIYALRTKAIRDLRRDAQLYLAITRKVHYDDAASYRYSAGRFKNSGLSSVEFIAIRNESEIRERSKSCS